MEGGCVCEEASPHSLISSLWSGGDLWFWLSQPSQASNNSIIISLSASLYRATIISFHLVNANYLSFANKRWNVKHSREREELTYWTSQKTIPMGASAASGIPLNRKCKRVGCFTFSFILCLQFLAISF